jgi:hypothetical protein
MHRGDASVERHFNQIGKIECRLGVNPFGVAISLIEAMDFLAVEALVSDLRPRAQRAH